MSEVDTTETNLLLLVAYMNANLYILILIQKWNL